MRFATATSKRGARRGAQAVSAFTLAEVLVAMLFMVIVVPVVVDAMHIASLSGEVAARKGEAALIADKVLNESIVTTNWSQGGLSGTVELGGEQYSWKLSSQNWNQDSSMELLSVEVDYPAGGRIYSVTMNTLANSTTASTPSTTGAAVQ
jgi:Tfp pilus assembly protein PilV